MGLYADNLTGKDMPVCLYWAGNSMAGRIYISCQHTIWAGLCIVEENTNERTDFDFSGRGRRTYS
jgi:hypothetical protein